MNGERLRFGFLANHYLLTVKLDIESLLPYLVAEGLISPEDSDLVRHEITSSLKTDKLLSILHRVGISNPSVFVKFYNILSDKDVTSGQNLEKLVEGIKRDSQSEDVRSRFEKVGGVLEERHNTALRSHEDKITRSLDVGSVLPQLVSYGVVTVEENLEIRSKPTLTKQAKHLLDIIMESGSSSFSIFVKVLSESDITKHLAMVLATRVDTSQRDDKYVREVLKQGHVPPQQNVYVERKEMIQKIQNELYKLRDNDGWVLVHGMAGFGKTVLAAEAVRDARILREVFPGGVNWLTVGQMTDTNGDFDSAKLLNKMQTLILRLDKNKSYRPPSVEAATDYLQEVISEQHPQSLLILDDVWSPDVAEAFAVRCRTMATSRNAAVANGVMTPNVFPVSVSDGFTEEEGKGLLALWLKTAPEKLPYHADTILEYCRGSPMAISLIGAILRKSSSEAKWKAIADKLKTKHYHLHAGHAAVRNWTYQHPTLNASIELSVESLPENLREYFDMFVVIFDYDTLIPGEALATIWGTDILDTEEYMAELVDYSLAQKANPGAQNASSLIYYVHDIVLDYLKDTIPSQDQAKYHQKVVAQYSKKCNSIFPDLQSDGYVYEKLTDHIVAAGYYELLGDLLSNLQWVYSNVRSGNTYTLLAFYRKYKGKVPERFTTAVQQFELFLSGHMYILHEQPKKDDFLQVALLQPDDSEVFSQAFALSRKEGRKSWFKWSNKESDPEKYALKLKLHNGGVRRCQYSQDGTKVLSCASSETKLWDSSTGMVLAEYKGHTNHITCCALSKSGRHVASSSDDCTVRVWDTRKKRLICNFTEHQYGVQCCAFSPDEKLILSGDIDSCIKLWETKTGWVLHSWSCGVLSPAITPVTTPTTHVDTPPDFLAKLPSRADSHGAGEGVLSCAFSPVDEIFVTSAQNGLVRVWDYKCKMINCLYGHTSEVRCSVFNRTGDKLATASLDGTAKVWNVKEGVCDKTLFHDDEAAVLCCDFSPDSKWLLTGDTYCSVKVWSVALGKIIQDLPLHWEFVNCVLYSPVSTPVSSHILSAADNGIVKILWDEGSEEEVEHLMSNVQYHRRFTAHFAEHGDSGYDPVIVCYYTKERKLQVVNGPKAEVVVDQIPGIPEGAVPRCWVISNNGDMIVVGFEDGLIQLYSLHQETPESEESPASPDPPKKKWTVTKLWTKQHSWSTSSSHLSPHTAKMKKEHDTNDSVLKCFFSPDDSKIVSCSNSQHKMWDIDGSEITVITAVGTGVRPCMFFKDNIHVISSQVGSVLLWDSNTGVSKRKYEGITDTKGIHSILCINLSEDNKRVVASATSGLIMVWEVSTAQVLLKSVVVPLNHCARSCALSPDGLLAVAGFDDGSMKVWDVTRNKEIASCQTGSDYWMIDVAFSPDGKTVVSLCDSISLWKPDGTHLKRIMLKGTFGKYIRFSPDFATFVTIDNAGLLYILTTLDDIQ